MSSIKTIGSLFSGIGGLELGLERAGCGAVKWQVEINEFCRRVLAKHWPHARRYDNVFECRDLERVDLICGGFPCQPFSVAGQRQGEDDSRHLWPEFRRIICAIGPRWVVAENVPGLLSIDAGRVFREVVGDLAAIGYRVRWDCISARAVGAPHIRDRVFIIADTEQVGRGAGSREQEDEVRSRQRGSEPVVGADTPDANRERCEGVEATRVHEGRPRRDDAAGCGDAAADTGRERMEVGDAGERDRRRGAAEQRDVHPWTGGSIPEPTIRRVDDGTPNRVDRIRALGNAVVPQVAQLIGEIILKLEKHQ